MAYSLGQRCTPFEGRPWTLKQVQGDDEREVGCGGRSLMQHLTPTPLRLGAPPLKRRGFSVAQSCSSMWSALDTLNSPGASTLSCRSEEHTSELQSLMRISYAVLCLKKKSQSDIKVDQMR